MVGSHFDTSRSSEDILQEIWNGLNQPHMPGLTIAPFALLIAKVSAEGQATIHELRDHITDLNKKNGKLQLWVASLAVASLIGTVIQAIGALYTLGVFGRG